MRRMVTYALVAVLATSGCSAVASPPATGQTPATADEGAGAGAATAAPSPQRPAMAPVVMILGDSYTMGMTGVPSEESFMAEAARTLGWQVILAGHPGTGFVAEGRIGKNFTALYEDKLSWRPTPDMVIVAGGHNDARQDPAQVELEARALLTEIQQRWPRTQVALVGPVWGSDPVPAALRVRDALQVVARELGIPFIDPLQGEWITGSVRRGTGTAERYIRPDGIHPNPAGVRYLAERLVTDLRTLGLDQPVLPPDGQ